jgi:bacillithiol biosynthesis cysteine-adding enzyme BshC
VLPPSGLSTLPARTTLPAPLPIDTRRFPWIRPLAADYAFAHAQLSAFFAGNPADTEAWTAAIARARQHARPRAEVADLLQAQQQARSAPAEALAASALLRDPATVAVVTGQQAGLFGGPLFTLLKALTAIRLADDVRTRHQVDAVPIFWIDAEDHDWNEVRQCTVFDAELAVRAVAAGDPPGANAGPVARVQLDASIAQTLDVLAATLPHTEFTAGVLDDLRRAYRPGIGMADAFGRWLESVLGRRGLIVYDASDPRAKPLVSHVFARELEAAGETSRLAARAGRALQERGYHMQVTPQEDAAALFHLNTGRDPIRLDGSSGFVINDARLSRDAIVDRARQAPHEFSPNVLLRPIVQDSLFPTVCYVSGPSELAYLGQLKEVYAAFGLPMPLVVPRATATIVDANAMRFLTRHDLPLEALRARDEAALNELLASQLPPHVVGSVDRVSRNLEEQMTQVAGAVTAIDATLEGATRSVLGRMQDDLKKLQGKIIQAAKKKDDTLRRQFHHAQAQAFPEGHPQEREIGFVYFLNKYGPALIDRLSDLLPGAHGTHYVLTL